jgi:hypothetical protein
LAPFFDELLPGIQVPSIDSELSLIDDYPDLLLGVVYIRFVDGAVPLEFAVDFVHILCQIGKLLRTIRYFDVFLRGAKT